MTNKTVVYSTNPYLAVHGFDDGPGGPRVNAGGPYESVTGIDLQVQGYVSGFDPGYTLVWGEDSGQGLFTDGTTLTPTYRALSDLPADRIFTLTVSGEVGGVPTVIQDTTPCTNEPYIAVSFTAFFSPFDLEVDVPISPRDASGAYSGNATPFVYSLTGTTWPAWVNLDVNTGIITGTPDTVEMTTGHTVTATDTRAGTAVSNEFAINVVPGVIEVEFIGNIADLVLEENVEMTPVLAWTEFNGTQTPITYSIVGTPLPTGLSLSTDGVISGTPTGDGITSGTIVRATDVDNNTADSNAFTTTVEPQVILLDAPLTHNLTLVKGTGVATFTRNTVATVMDYQGIIQTVPAGTARFQGARWDGSIFHDTEANGTTPIPDSTLFGYMSESASENKHFNSEAMDLWVESNGTQQAGSTLNPDGTTSTVSKLTANNVGGTGGVRAYLAATSIAAGVNTCSIYAKADTLNYLRILTANGPSASAYFNLTTGAVTGATGTISAGATAVGNGWWRCWLTFDSVDDLSMRFQYYLSSNGLGTTVNLNGTDAVYIWGAQVELGSFVTSYIKTEASAVTRQADVLTYEGTGNIEDAAGTVKTNASTYWTTAGAASYAIARDANGAILFGDTGDASTIISTSDGTSESTSPAGTDMYLALQEIKSDWGADLTAYINGAAGTPAAYVGTMGTGAIGVGVLNTGGNQWDGTIKNLVIYPAEDQ